MGPDLVPIAADWSDWVGLMVTTDCGLVSSLFLAAILIFGPILGHIKAKTGAFGAPGPGPRIVALRHLKCWVGLD